jgi:hypothetical protein
VLIFSHDMTSLHVMKGAWIDFVYAMQKISELTNTLEPASTSTTVDLK